MVGVRGQRLKDNVQAGLRVLEGTAEAERLRLALLGAGEAAFDWTIADDRIVWSGARLLRSYHPDADEWNSGKRFCEWLIPHARDKLLALIEERSPAEPAFTLEFETITAERRAWFELRGTRIPDVSGRAERIAGVLRSITEQKATLDRLAYLAGCDELTGHLNRARLRDELSRVITRANTENRSRAYLVAAIDSLGVINETYGFDIADEVIVATGQRLARTLRGSDIIGRTAGNKFGIVLGESNETEVAVVAERLYTAVRNGVVETLAGPVSVTISIGAVLLPAGASTSQEAMLRAEEALERAKRKGRNGFAVFAKSAQRESSRRKLMSLADDIMTALDQDRLVLAYQPIVTSDSRQPKYYESLVRVSRKDGSMMNAGDFIPAAETLGLVHLIDRRALEMAVQQLYGHPDINLSINVSGTTANDGSWLQSFIAYVRENRAVAERMTVELTETAALYAFEENARFVTRLRDMGCRVAIDDFGAGYTSFRNLHTLRVDIVKIDGSYVQGVSKSPDNQLFVRTLVGLAKNFEIATVAEWVDNEEDAEFLAGLGIDYFQGFHFGRPEVVPGWIRK
jgi:diguanylate cyclase (GGDEF)-like protein